MRALTTWHEAYKEVLTNLSDNSNTIDALYNFSIVLSALLLGFLSYKLGKWVIYKLAKNVGERHKRKEFHLIASLYHNKFFSYLSYYFPLLIIRYNLSIIIPKHEKIYLLLERVYGVVAVILFVFIINSILNTIIEINQTRKANRSKPVKGLIQFLQIIIYFFGVIICISILFTDSPLKLIGGLGAASAVLMLIFKDSIMGLVGGVQLSLNKTIEIGDWISLPKYDADGEVIDITLTSIKVRNWDNSISTIPSYNLIVTDSIKNWQGMKQAGARRISRFINIDMNSVQFCTSEMLENYMNIENVKEALANVKELNGINTTLGNSMQDNTEKTEHNFVISGKNLTNLGVFRAYVYAYLESKKEIRKDMDLIVRQKQPALNGLPFEIYCFVNTTVTKDYERIQSDIFDHLLSTLPYFNLKTYQNTVNN